jgi:DNA polymerase alpha subunit A
VLLLDFNSLYPSIIQEYNICFTTVKRPTATDAADSMDDMAVLPEKSVAPGVLPRLLESLVARRRQVKQLMKARNVTAAELAQLDTRQKALKLTANSMYGCLGFTSCRFYAKHLAMLITGKGRAILQQAVSLARDQLQLDVIYGDTVFIGSLITWIPILPRIR